MSLLPNMLQENDIVSVLSIRAGAHQSQHLIGLRLFGHEPRLFKILWPMTANRDSIIPQSTKLPTTLAPLLNPFFSN
jgi:hypothetical protein